MADYTSLNDELNEILESLQSGDLSVDEALPAYERGQKIITLLETQLKTAENNVSKLQAKKQA